MWGMFPLPVWHPAVWCSSTSSVYMQICFQFCFTLPFKSLLLCRHQKWGRKIISKNTKCPGALLLDSRDGDSRGPFVEGCSSNPLLFPCIWCPLSSIPVPMPSCPRPYWQWSVITMLVEMKLSAPWLSLLVGWTPPAGSCKDSCPDHRVLGRAASELLPASWGVEVWPEGSGPLGWALVL